MCGGTTTANYMATIHREATETLCDIAEERGQRALIGKVCMNRNGFGGYVEKSAKDSLNETRIYLSGVISKKLSLVEPVVVPRFAVSCDRALMVGLGEIAKEYDARIHTHLAESKPEVRMCDSPMQRWALGCVNLKMRLEAEFTQPRPILADPCDPGTTFLDLQVAWMRELEPWADSYTHVYEATGLLTDKTVLAHCIYLDDDEVRAIRESGAGVAHCPNSNCSIRSGNMDARRMKGENVRVGLGSDCSAGYSPSVLENMRFAVATSNQVHIRRGEDGVDYRDIHSDGG